MKTNVTDTSLNSYDQLKGSKYLADSYKKILSKMRFDRSYSRRQIANLAKMETSSVAGRVNELLFMRQIEVIGKKLCPISKKTVEAIQKVKP